MHSLMQITQEGHCASTCARRGDRCWRLDSWAGVMACTPSSLCRSCPACSAGSYPSPGCCSPKCCRCCQACTDHRDVFNELRVRFFPLTARLILGTPQLGKCGPFVGPRHNAMRNGSELWQASCCGSHQGRFHTAQSPVWTLTGNIEGALDSIKVCIRTLQRSAAGHLWPSPASPLASARGLLPGPIMSRGCQRRCPAIFICTQISPSAMFGVTRRRICFCLNLHQQASSASCMPDHPK